ncbi:hypothetical protein [Deinococcus cellulosilyticus]|uniref:Uncharacterized protein n=1 Tax=Deinococcus cellulosilyticus (strain DSM 18568 / NBRC 106333 / KACC 11606 / 5516J-15) TaxID=1223518 RepID=A0A511N769_DEIC1|nr:hypothetical protein [Deinococcus cellulosilyticus]GEM48685.1 hypothetical protein DC3_43200 [Deinococcus cellulosilyticus NBRC 106333 = KACC 11606]
MVVLASNHILEEPVASDSPILQAVTTDSKYTYYRPDGDEDGGEYSLVGPDFYMGASVHLIPRASLCVESYDNSPNFYFSHVVPPNAVDPEGNSYFYTGMLLQAWSTQYANLTLKALSIHVRYGHPGNPMYYELLAVREYGEKELVAVLHHMIPEYHLDENDNWVVDGMLPLEGFSEKGIMLHKFNNRRHFELRVSRRTDYGVSPRDHDLADRLEVRDLPKNTFLPTPSDSNMVLHRIEGTLDPLVIPDETVLLPLTNTAPTRHESLAYQTNLFRKVYLVFDVLSAVGLKAIKVKVDRASTSDTGQLVLSLWLTDLSLSGPQVDTFSYEDHLVDVADTTPDGYIVHTFSEYYSNFFNSRVDTRHQLHISIRDAAAGSYMHNPNHDLYLFSGDPANAVKPGVKLPMWDYNDTGKPVHGLTAPSGVAPILGLTHGSIKEYTPVEPGFLASHTEVPAGSLMLSNTITNVVPDVRFVTHPYQIGDDLARYLGSVELFGRTEVGPAGGPVVFTARLERMPFTYLYDLKLMGVNASADPSAEPLELAYDVFAVPGHVDPATYDFTDTTHRIAVFRQTIYYNGTESTGLLEAYQGDPAHGGLLPVGGEVTLMVRLENPPADLRHVVTELDPRFIPRSHPTLRIEPDTSYGTGFFPLMEFTFLVAPQPEAIT